MTGSLRYGTSSFSSKGWVGPFYPAGTKPGDFLTAYAEHFDTVEIDATYYAVPAPAMVHGWERKVPEGFRICAKFPRSIVHAGEGPRPDPQRLLASEESRKDTEAFLEVMRGLGAKCGPLLLQFPYFNKAAFADRAPFLERLEAYLEALPETYRYAVEVRNKGWIDEALLGVLRRHRAALVLVELPYMPHPQSLWSRLDLVTCEFAYCRLIGDRKATDARTKTFDSLVLDKGPEMKRWAAVLRQLRERVPETHVFANNHYAGHAPATIRELAALVNPEETPF